MCFYLLKVLNFCIIEFGEKRNVFILICLICMDNVGLVLCII